MSNDYTIHELYANCNRKHRIRTTVQEYTKGPLSNIYTFSKIAIHMYLQEYYEQLSNYFHFFLQIFQIFQFHFDCIQRNIIYIKLFCQFMIIKYIFQCFTWLFAENATSLTKKISCCVLNSRH